MVTIGVPVYNGQRYLREALDSALNQTFSDLEVVIVDNHSQDATEKICRDYAACDSRVRYIRNPANFGPHWNFYFSVREARGQLFTWLAHDDVLEPQFLERTVPYILQNPATTIVVGDFDVIDENGTTLRIEKLDELRDSLPWEKRRIPFFEYGYRNYHLCFYGLMRTKLCKAILEDVAEPDLRGGSEYPILARFAVAGEIASLPTVLRKYRVHQTSVFLSEVSAIEQKAKIERIFHFYHNLAKMRIDLFGVLVRAPFPLKSKLRILRRHMILDFRWYLYKIGQTLHIHRD